METEDRAKTTMTTDLSNKTACVICSGLFAEVSVRLARDFGKVYLIVPHAGAFPTVNVGILGMGLEGVERIDSIWPLVDEIDLFVFPDLGHAALQVYLESIGKRVWGSRNGEELEIYREVCKNVMESVGLAVAPWKLVKGIEALRAHLKSHENQHVKIDRWRGNFETFCSPNYDLSKPKIDDIAHNMGAFQTEAEFIVEDDLPDRVEIGLDCYCIDGLWPVETLVGIEVKDLGYCAQFKAWEDIPQEIREWNEKMGPTLGKYGYRGFLSTEVRIGKDKIPYMIDACCRAGSPPNELYQEFYTNFSDIIWSGADGFMVDPTPVGKFGVEVILKSRWAEDHWQPIEFPSEFRNLIKLFNPVVIDGKHYVVPQDEEMPEIGAVVGYGDTLKDAIDMAQEVGDSISGYGIKFNMGPIDAAQEQMDKLEELGVSPFTLAKSSSRS